MLIQCEIRTHDHTLEKGSISSNKIIQKKSYCNAVELFRFIIIMNMIFRLSMAGSRCYGEGPWWAHTCRCVLFICRAETGSIRDWRGWSIAKDEAHHGLDTLCDDLCNDGEEIYYWWGSTFDILWIITPDWCCWFWVLALMKDTYLYCISICMNMSLLGNNNVNWKEIQSTQQIANSFKSHNNFLSGHYVLKIPIKYNLSDTFHCAIWEHVQSNNQSWMKTLPEKLKMSSCVEVSSGSGRGRNEHDGYVLIFSDPQKF